MSKSGNLLYGLSILFLCGLVIASVLWAGIQLLQAVAG